jgi:hypothetical protein
LKEKFLVQENYPARNSKPFHRNRAECWGTSDHRFSGSKATLWTIAFIAFTSNEELIREHAGQGGFPANRISEVRTIIDPTTAESAAR